MAQGVTDIVIDINGSDFDTAPVGVDGNPVAVVTFTNPDISLSSTVITSGLIQVTISVAQPGSFGPGTVTVTNGDTAFDSATFTIYAFIITLPDGTQVTPV